MQFLYVLWHVAPLHGKITFHHPQSNELSGNELSYPACCQKQNSVKNFSQQLEAI